MALIKCPDCGTEVSDQAAACPKCARPLNAPKTTSSAGRIMALLFGIGMLLLFFSGFQFFVPFDTAVLGGLLCIAALLTK